MTKDNTPAQATRWAKQEAAKHSDRRSIEERIFSERHTMRLCVGAGLDLKLPNSYAAHQQLIDALEKKLEAL